MLRPTKHCDPSLSIINIAGLTIEVLRQNDIMSHDDLLTSLTERTSESVKEVYYYALSFLYILNKLEYIVEIDALRIPR